MKRFSFHISFVLFSTAVALGGFVVVLFQSPAVAENIVEEPAAPEAVASVDAVVDVPAELSAPIPTYAFAAPIQDAKARVTKKPFGLYVTPDTSPVAHDRFTGYHVGTDFETFENEADVDVPISAICAGPLLFKKYASGYGGVAVQECELSGRTVSVIYGHLNLASIAHDAGDALAPGEHIGVLGKGYSTETDGVRKHLHLGIHDGSPADIRGYVPEEADMSAWVDVLPHLTF